MTDSSVNGLVTMSRKAFQKARALKTGRTYHTATPPTKENEVEETVEDFFEEFKWDKKKGGAVIYSSDGKHYILEEVLRAIAAVKDKPDHDEVWCSGVGEDDPTWFYVAPGVVVSVSVSQVEDLIRGVGRQLLAATVAKFQRDSSPGGDRLAGNEHLAAEEA